MKITSILLDHKLFMALVGAFFVLCVGLLVYIQFFAQNNLQPQDLLEDPITRPKVEFPLVFNVVKGDFTSSEKEILNLCSKSWKTNTKGVADIRFNFDWDPPQKFNEEFYKTFPEKTLWKRLSTDEEILYLQLNSTLVADGVSRGNFIMIINDYFDPLFDQKLYSIIMHELGHQLALEHIKLDYPALMNVNLNLHTGTITKNDIIVFCSIYDCK